MLVAALLACGEPELPDAPPPLVHRAIDDAEAMALPLSELDAAIEAWATEADAASADGVTGAREAARLLRLRAYRTGEGEPLDRARTLLEAASLRRTVQGACDAALDLSRLLARDARRPSDAYEAAYRLIRRFREPADLACATEARRITATLEAYRPDAARLAVIDADPDRDDPSAFGVPATAEDETALEAWARERSVPTETGTITAIETYGERGGASARLVVTCDRVLPLSETPVAAEGDLPPRLAIDLPLARLADGLAPAIPVGAGGLVRVRASADDLRARVVLDLEEGATTSVYALADPFRVVIDVAAAGAGPREAARTLSLVVIDPGHGGDDYGARAFGLHEADLTLDLALRVRSSLLALRPDLRVVMTREDDTFVSLEQRAAMANAIGADVFVSIHLNAADEPVDHGGITTFVLDTEGDRSAVRLAARENGTSAAEVTELSRILAGLHRTEQVAGSRVLATSIHGSLLRSGRTVLRGLHDRGVRSAMFYVLVGATMPAVLVEASFMTREDEAQALRTTRYRDAIAAGIAEGIVGYESGPPANP